MIYKLHCDRLTNDFIAFADGAFDDMLSACIASEFHKISTEPTEISTSDTEGGIIFPEFYYDDAVPLFSEKIYNEMKKFGIEYIFEKEITVTAHILEKSEKYVLALPPRLPVLDNNGNIDEKKAGRCCIFKSDDFGDNSIYITKELKEFFEKIKPLGMVITDVL